MSEVRINTTPDGERVIAEIKAQAAEQGVKLTKAQAITTALEFLQKTHNETFLVYNFEKFKK